MNSNIDIRKRNFLNALQILNGTPNSIGDAVYTREQCLAAIGQSYALGGQTYSVLPAWLTQDKNRRTSRGKYSIPEMVVVEYTPAESDTPNENIQDSSPNLDVILY
jgi:hypothetical protein